MPGLCTCHNSAPIGEDGLAGGIPIKSSNTLTFFLIISWLQTPTPIQASTPAPTLDSLSIYTNITLQRATRLALKLFVKDQKHNKVNSIPWDKVFKARNPNLYYGSSNMECYYFSQQCKDHFNTAGATGL